MAGQCSTTLRSLDSEENIMKCACLNHGDDLLFRSQSKNKLTNNVALNQHFFYVLPLFVWLGCLPYFLKNFLSVFTLLSENRLSPALCSGVVVVNMLFAVTSLSPNTPPSFSSSSSSSDDDDENDDEENKGKKKTKWLVKKKNLSRISHINLMRRAQSLGDLLLTTTTNNKKNKKKKKKNASSSRIHTYSYQTLAIVILSSLLIFSLLVIKQQNKNRKIRDIDRKLHHTISALATRAQWSLEEVSNGEKTKWWKKYNHPQQHDSIQNLPLGLLDEYGLPTLQQQCERKVEWPTVAFMTSSFLCESFLEVLPKTLRVHTFPLNTRAQMKYNSLRKLPTFNRGYDVEDYLVKWLSDGPFSINRNNRVKTLTEKTEIAYLLPIQPYLDRVSSFPFTDGRESSESGLKSAVQYAKKVNPSLWKQSKGRRVIVSVHDFGTELATKIFPDDDENDIDDIYYTSASSSSMLSPVSFSSSSSSSSTSSSLINTTHFIVSNSEIGVENAPFDAQKDVAVIPSLSFYLPREAVSRGLVDLSHFLRNEEEYASVGLELPKLDAERNIRLIFRGNNRGPLREKVFRYLIENGSPEDSIETTGVASPQAYMSLMEHSKYCLHVRGTRVMSPRLIELMLFGCVPVIVADAYELPLAWFLDWTKFSIRVPESEYENIHAYVEKANWRELHSNLGRVISFFVYHKDKPIIGDAFYATSLALLNKLEQRASTPTTPPTNNNNNNRAKGEE